MSAVVAIRAARVSGVFAAAIHSRMFRLDDGGTRQSSLRPADRQQAPSRRSEGVASVSTASSLLQLHLSIFSGGAHDGKSSGGHAASRDQPLYTLLVDV